MSRIGKRILTVPENVTITVNGTCVTVKGPKGELSTEINRNITVTVENNEVTVERKNDNFKNFHGTANANINNMIIGVTEGYAKGLEAVGVGYRFNVSGEKITVSAGYSHPVIVEIPSELTVEQISNTEIVIKGIDKCQVGEFAANIRKIRKPEPYKGKGIRYKGEVVLRKEGKKAA
ncbi:MAG: 50S ribosomal protein L6 [Bacilli bacterium]|nr:50S ribosomal protein L6 [Bacilli bacterium]